MGLSPFLHQKVFRSRVCAARAVTLGKHSSDATPATAPASPPIPALPLHRVRSPPAWEEKGAEQGSDAFLLPGKAGVRTRSNHFRNPLPGQGCQWIPSHPRARGICQGKSRGDRQCEVQAQGRQTGRHSAEQAAATRRRQG